MEGADWLRTQLTSFACGRCGRSYVASHIRVLAQRDDLFVVDFDCDNCGSRAVAFVTVEVESSEEELEEPVETVAETAAPPLAGDDVLDMHLFLRHFDGDFRALFAKDADPSSSDGR